MKSVNRSIELDYVEDALFKFKNVHLPAPNCKAKVRQGPGTTVEEQAATCWALQLQQPRSMQRDFREQQLHRFAIGVLQGTSRPVLNHENNATSCAQEWCRLPAYV